MRGRIKSTLVLTAVLAVASATFASFAIAGGASSLHHDGGTPSCGNSCDSSGNPTDFHKPCDNNGDNHSNSNSNSNHYNSKDNHSDDNHSNGCHTLPDTPCERGHGNAEEHNKHCVPETLPKIFLGYADTYFPRGTGLPTIWNGSPGVIFVGCGVNPNEDGPAMPNTCPQELQGPVGDSYDAGAIRIDNPSATAPLVVTGPASVTIGTCVYPMARAEANDPAWRHADSHADRPRRRPVRA